jgi:hypothetical protein
MPNRRGRKPQVYYNESDVKAFESLPDEVKDILRGLSYGSLYHGVKCIRAKHEDVLEYKFKTRLKNVERFEGFAFGLLHSLVFPRVMGLPSINKLFKGFNPGNVQIFINCFVCSQLKQFGLFSNDNIISYYSNFSKQLRINHTNEGLRFLIDKGLIFEVSELQIYELTRLHKQFEKKNKHYYKLSRKGIILMTEFIKIYEVEHKKITGDIWSNDLIKLNTKIDQNL